MTSAQIVAQLKKFGISYKEYKDWKTHNRNHKGKWGPVHGLMVHHTGSDSKDQRELLYAGTSTLPGPLCHFGLSQDGTIHLVGWGRANHAGLGDDDVLDAVIAQKDAPEDDESNTDGNARFYGVEIWLLGKSQDDRCPVRDPSQARCGVGARNIAKAAAARKLLTLVYYGLRDGEVRCLTRRDPV